MLKFSRQTCCPDLADNHCTCALIGKQLAQQYMLLATIYDMNARNGSQSIKAGRYLRDHPTANHALFDQFLGLGLGQFRDESPVVTVNAYYIAQEDQFLGVESARDMSGYQIGVNIQTGAFRPFAKRGDNRNEPFVNHCL